MMSIEKYLAEEKSRYDAVMKQSTRGQSAYHLITMALQHGGSSSRVAAKLLLSLEQGGDFNLQELVLLDSTNRGHADLLILSCEAHNFKPSRWITEEGHDGNLLIGKLKDRWE